MRQSNDVHTVPSTIQNTRTLGISIASSTKTILLSFLFLNLKIIFFHDQGFARDNLQGIDKRIVIDGAHIASNLKGLVCWLCQIKLTFVQEFFFEREPVFRRYIRRAKQAGNSTDLCRTTDDGDRFLVTCSINLIKLSGAGKVIDAPLRTLVLASCA